MNSCLIFEITAKPWFLSPIIMGDSILKFGKILWGQNSFLHLSGDEPLWGSKNYMGE